MAHEGLWEQLDKLDPSETAHRADCRFFPEPDRFVLPMLGAEYVINLAERDISARQGETTVPAAFLEQLCLLAYLINARDLPLANKLVQAETLPGGQFFFRGLHSLPTGKLEKAFGDNPDALLRTSKQFDAEQCEFGDAAVRLHVLPRIPLTIVIWRADEEFDARASILFDETVAAQIPLDALLTAVNLAVSALVKTAEAGA